MGAVSSALSRRRFVATLSAAGGLALGFNGRADAAALGTVLQAAETPTPQEINAWIVIDPDDSVLLRLSHAEMGQGAGTTLPMILAEELQCDWSKVKVEYASASRNAREKGVYGPMATVGSRGTRTSVAPLQKAGANARVRLIAAAAKRWNVAPDTCEARDSKITHKPTGRTLTYGAVAADAVKVKLDVEPAVKTPEQYTLMGKPIPRLDTPLKVDGTAQFGIDVRLPDMAYAAVISCPVPGGTLKSFDAKAIEGRKGVIAVVPMKDSIAVAAEGNYWAAKSALEAVHVEWETGAAGKTNSAQFNQLYRDALKEKNPVAEQKGNIEDAFKGAAKQIEAIYEVPYQAHAPMEPLNATVRFTGDQLEVWIGTQQPGGVLGIAAAASGLPPANITVHNQFLGGGFGRRGKHDELPHAIAVAQAIKRPVKLVWSREQDIRQDRYRPQAAIGFKGAIAKDGTPVGMEITTAVGSLFRSLGMGKVEDGIEPVAVEGLSGNPYGIPNQRINCALRNMHIPVSFWRSVGASQNGFAIEGFIDEMAYACGKDPAAFRRSLISRPDFLGVLDKIIEKSNWNTPLPKGRGRGIAVHECYGSIMGQVAEVTVSPNGDLKVDRFVAAVDCGHIVNPSIIEAQIQGAVIWGLSAALHSEITVKDGAVEQSNFNDFRILSLAETPDIEVHFALSGGEKWGGIGEPGASCVAPALCNAIFAATGKRIRRLPIKDQLKTLSA